MTTCLTKELDEVLEKIVDIIGNNHTKNVFKHFLNVTQVPRGSNESQDDLSKSKLITETLTKWAANMGYTHYIDTGANIIINKPASKGFEHLPPICIQAHMDMVTEAEKDYDINFLTDPIKPMIVNMENNEYIKADRTTLGADDGIGLGSIFSILEDRNLVHPPLEMLITRDEETGLYGALSLEPNVLKAKYFINIDSEEWKSVCIGCAGGFAYKINHTVTRDNSTTNNIYKKITVFGLLGGHSGADIHLGRINAIQIMGRFLSKCISSSFLICNVNGGSADNAIPRECTCIISIDKDNSELFNKLLMEEYECIREEHIKIDPLFKIEIEDMKENHSDPLNSVESLKLVNFLNCVPIGPLRWNPDVEGLVDTSNNIGIIKLDTFSLEVIGCARSFVDSQLNTVYSTLRSLCKLNGYHMSKKLSQYPGWKPNPDHILNKILTEESEKAYDRKDIRVYAVHAGLECGVILEKYPDLLCSSIGPEINYAHSPDERLLIKSVDGFYKTLINTLRRFTTLN